MCVDVCVDVCVCLGPYYVLGYSYGAVVAYEVCICLSFAVCVLMCLCLSFAVCVLMYICLSFAVCVMHTSDVCGAKRDHCMLMCVVPREIIAC